MSVGAASRCHKWAHELEEACAPLHYLCVTDVTDGHAIEGVKDGRALRADGRDIKVSPSAASARAVAARASSLAFAASKVLAPITLSVSTTAGTHRV